MKYPIIVCPFCGEEIEILATDAEGNERDWEYEQDPWSGLGFVPIHEYTRSKNCPIATHEGEILGCQIYESRAELIKAFTKES